VPLSKSPHSPGISSGLPAGLGAVVKKRHRNHRWGIAHGTHISDAVARNVELEQFFEINCG
jgi:hypothetical protein